jgi:hypothetical protein
MDEPKLDPVEELQLKKMEMDFRHLEMAKRRVKRHIFLALFFAVLNVAGCYICAVQGGLSMAIVFGVTLFFCYLVSKFHLSHLSAAALFGFSGMLLNYFIIGGLMFFTWLVWIAIGVLAGVAYTEERGVEV